MTPDQANSLGLILDMLGIVVIFIWGPPQPKLEEGSALLLSGAAYADEDKKTRRKHKLYTIMSRVGLLMILAGFGFQLLAVWI